VSAPELWLLPSEPSPPRTSALPLLGALTPLVMATLLFALTRSPYALILAVVSPVTMLATRSFHRRSERNRITRETQKFSDEVCDLRLRAAEYHQREREMPICWAFRGNEARSSRRDLLIPRHCSHSKPSSNTILECRCLFHAEQTLTSQVCSQLGCELRWMSPS
jgi:hypothetical protein